MFEARKEEEREGGRKSWRREGERKTLKEGRREREGGKEKEWGGNILDDGRRRKEASNVRLERYPKGPKLLSNLFQDRERGLT